VLCGIPAGAVLADVSLPAVFSSHMVLQRDSAVKVWGTADAGEGVTVSFAGQTRQTRAASDGRWSVTLDAMPAGGPHEMVVTAYNTLRYENVLLGDVWVCSGQSNMQWSVGRASDPEKEIAAAKHPSLRLFSVQRTVAGAPLSDVTGTWMPCSPETVESFSAVGYFFGRKLHQELDVPIGLLHTSWGGTPSEAWTSMATLQVTPVAQPILERWEETLEHSPEAMKRHAEKVKEWEEKRRAAEAKGEKPPRKPRKPRGADHPHRPGGLFNAMIAPLLQYAIRGAIWYQGESNASRAYQYGTIFPAMILDWRGHWGQGDFPFYWVQLANFRARVDEPDDSDWAELREAQNKALALPNTGTAVIIDIGEADDIHPRNKQDVGKRLALAALAETYGHDIVYSGPMYKAHAVEGDKVRVYFDHVGGGLEARGEDALVGFAIAASDQEFVWAKATIEDGAVVLHSDQVKAPVAVRYGWAHNPLCNLYNKEGLPASPFRTDQWPGVTINAR